MLSSSATSSYRAMVTSPSERTPERDDLRRPCDSGGLQDVPQQRAAGDRMQDLRYGRPEPLALPGREHHHGENREVVFSAKCASWVERTFIVPDGGQVARQASFRSPQRNDQDLPSDAGSVHPEPVLRQRRSAMR